MKQIIILNRNWFLERIGKKIKRHRKNCPCLECEENRTETLVIKDEAHAIEIHLDCVKNKKLYFDV
jgi:hypothetical protein